jgi:ABC-type antimicrobial peptide transport system ATPase subunit
VEDSNKHIIEETVRQVGYLPELQESEIIHTLTDSRKQDLPYFSVAI